MLGRILQWWLDFHRRWGCRILLASLLLVVVLFPYLETYVSDAMFSALKVIVLVSAVAAVGAERRHVLIAAMIGAIDIGLSITAPNIVRQLGDALAISIARLVVMGLLATYVVYWVLRFVLGAREITKDQIYAGISLYLMIGFTFGSLYFILLTLDPGCFAVQGSLQQAMGPIPDVMYFSFVTLTTVGFGDITPVNPIARSLAQLEALSGTLYMATFMARLVSLHASRKQ